MTISEVNPESITGRVQSLKERMKNFQTEVKNLEEYLQPALKPELTSAGEIGRLTSSDVVKESPLMESLTDLELYIQEAEETLRKLKGRVQL